jgi:hypothetical protein
MLNTFWHAVKHKKGSYYNHPDYAFQLYAFSFKLSISFSASCRVPG